MKFAYDKRKYPMGPFIETVDDLVPTERELYEVLDLIVAEFETDPSSVACFDLRIVERAKAAVAPFRQLRKVERK